MQLPQSRQPTRHLFKAAHKPRQSDSRVTQSIDWIVFVAKLEALQALNR